MTSASKTIRVLCVDDDESDLEILKMAFDRHSKLIPETVELECLGDGNLAIDKMRSHPPHLVLLDLNMPNMSGLEVLGRRLLDRELQSVPIVVLSGSTAPDEMKRAWGMGISGYLEKPDGYQSYKDLAAGICAFWVQLNQFAPT